MKTDIAIDISPLYLAKFWASIYGRKCCQPVKLHDSWKCNILRKKWMMKFIFCMQINIEVFYKLIISILVGVIRHNQSTQNNFTCLCNISMHAYFQAWRMRLIFCLQINAKVYYKMIVSLWVFVARHVQSTENNKFKISLQYLKENVKDELDFFLLINFEGFFKVILPF